MHTESTVADKIRELYPLITHLNLRVTATRYTDASCWVIQLKKGKYVLKTVLENRDVDLLFSGRSCQSLTVELQHLTDSLKVLELR